jgi:hypothetical protein
MPLPYKTTILTAAASHDLTVLETVKQELDITDNDSDDELARLISEQSAVATAYCQREFAQETVLDVFRPEWSISSPLKVSRTPIVSITSIVEAGITLGASIYEFSDANIWRLDISGGRMEWPAGKIDVTYVSGFQLLTTLPRDLERGVLVLIRQAWYSGSRDPLAISESVDGVGRTDYKVGSGLDGEALPAEALALLSNYRRYSV